MSKELSRRVAEILGDLPESVVIDAIERVRDAPTMWWANFLDGRCMRIEYENFMFTVFVCDEPEDAGICRHVYQVDSHQRSTMSDEMMFALLPWWVVNDREMLAEDYETALFEAQETLALEATNG